MEGRLAHPFSGFFLGVAVDLFSTSLEGAVIAFPFSVFLEEVTMEE